MKLRARLVAVVMPLVACRSSPAAVQHDPAAEVGPLAPVASPAALPSSASAPAAAAPPAPPADAPAVPVPVHVEAFPEEKAYVLRGSRSKSYAVLFGGQCSQPQGYVESIQLAAARHTQLVALQGDKPCTGDFKGWSFDLEALSRRIDRTFLALGFGEPRDVLLIGYSQGASVAQMLAQKEPEKYTRFVLIAQPRQPEPWHFKKARAVATMAGTLDRQDHMVRGARALEDAGVRARYFPLPGAPHGYMGTDPEGTFEKVFTWLDEAS